MDKTNNLDIFMTDLADSIREATGETGSINAQSFSTRITGLGAGKQDKLVSGENIKTINGESLLGSGDLTISGGSSSGDGIVTKIEAIAPKMGTLAFVGNELYPAIKANTIYVQETAYVASPLSVVNISAFEETTDVYVEYVLIFQTARSAPQIILPDYVKWANGSIPTIEAHTTYELNIARSILAGEATYCAVLTPFKPVE